MTAELEGHRETAPGLGYRNEIRASQKGTVKEGGGNHAIVAVGLPATPKGPAAEMPNSGDANERGESIPTF